MNNKYIYVSLLHAHTLKNRLHSLQQRREMTRRTLIRILLTHNCLLWGQGDDERPHDHRGNARTNERTYMCNKLTKAILNWHIEPSWERKNITSNSFDNRRTGELEGAAQKVFNKAFCYDAEGGTYIHDGKKKYAKKKSNVTKRTEICFLIVAFFFFFFLKITIVKITQFDGKLCKEIMNNIQIVVFWICRVSGFYSISRHRHFICTTEMLTNNVQFSNSRGKLSCMISKVTRGVV